MAKKERKIVSNYNLIKPKEIDDKIINQWNPVSLPRVVRVEVSGLCNLKCIHCPTGTTRNNNRGNISKKIIHKIIDEIKDYNEVAVVVLYHGGEPFLNKDIFEIIKLFKKIGIPFVKTVTNGTVLNDEMLTKIIDTGLDSINFSLDGLSPDENNKIRKGADCSQVISIIKKLLLLKRNVKSSTPDVFINNTQFPTEVDILSGQEASVPDYLVNEFSEFEGEIEFRCNYMYKWPGFSLLEQYRLVESPVFLDSQPSNYCDSIINIISVRWNGDVVPCCYDIMGDYVIGNIMEHPLIEIWNNERYKKIRRSVQLRRYIPLCASCRVVRPQMFVVQK